MAASFGKAKDRKQPRCLSGIDWLNNDTVIQ